MHTVLSGPAAGVIAAANLAGQSGVANLITYDMGGDQPRRVTGRRWPAADDRWDGAGVGIPIMVSMVGIHTVGAGGGSIARVDPGGILRVGPESAGAEPGPVGYGRGGTEPTFTDAQLVLGRINPRYPIGGAADLAFDVPRARAAIARADRCAARTRTGSAAQAIITVATNRIAGSLRRVSVDRGARSTRLCPVCPPAAPGPLLVSALLRELGAAQALVPYAPGIASAWGCAIADRQHDFVTMLNRRLADLDLDEVARCFAAHEAAGRALLRQEPLPLVETRIVREAELSYEGQTHVVRTPLPSGALTRDQIAASFRSAYLQRYGQTEESFAGLGQLLERIPIRLLNLRTAVIGVRPQPGTQGLPATTDDYAGRGLQGHAVRLRGRPVYRVSDVRACPTPLGRAGGRPSDYRAAGYDHLAGAGIAATVDEAGNLLLEVA